MQQSTIGFIGAGNMATSLINGLRKQGWQGSDILAADIDQDKLQALAESCQIQGAEPDTLAQQADVIVLAVKPQVMGTVCKQLAQQLGDRPVLLISIAAGITLEHLQRWLGEQRAIVRCMPNTPALIGKGASGLYANANVSAAQRELAQAVMSTAGLSLWLEAESDVDTVTAVSGSGPAYFFLFMEAMQDCAKELGLSEASARDLVYQTALGAAELAASSTDDSAELRRKVTSPGGTTEAAINTFEAGKLRELVRSAMQAAHGRSIELSQEFGADEA